MIMLTKISQAIFHINHYSRKIFTTAFKFHLQFCIFKMFISWFWIKGQLLAFGITDVKLWQWILLQTWMRFESCCSSCSSCIKMANIACWFQTHNHILAYFSMYANSFNKYFLFVILKLNICIYLLLTFSEDRYVFDWLSSCNSSEMG